MVSGADPLIVTSDWLDRKPADANPHRVLIRNATDYERQTANGRAGCIAIRAGAG